MEILHRGGWVRCIPDMAYIVHISWNPMVSQSFTNRSIISDGAARLMMPYALLRLLCCIVCVHEGANPRRRMCPRF